MDDRDAGTRLTKLGPQDRPREKLETGGVASLGDNELLALVLGHGTAGADALAVANALLAAAGGTHGLTRASRAQLTHVPGVGTALACRVQAAIELGRRTLYLSPPARQQFLSPADAARFLLPRFGASAVERFGVMMLDTRRRLIRVQLISSGSLDTASAHPREVFREAAIAGAAAVVVFHNHPSGDPSPSVDDVPTDAAARGGGGDRRHRSRRSSDPGGYTLFFVARLGGLQVARVMYLDCFSGAAGDMLLAALLDAGLPLAELRAALGSLAVGHAVDVHRVMRAGISAAYLQVRESRPRPYPRAAAPAHARTLAPTPIAPRDCASHRAFVALASGEGPCGRAVSTHRRRRSGDSRPADRAGPPA